MYLTRAIRQQGAVSGFRYAFKRATTKEHFQGIVAVQRDCFASPKERTTANALEAMVLLPEAIFLSICFIGNVRTSSTFVST